MFTTMVGNYSLWEDDDLNHMVVIVCPLVPMIIFLRIYVYNNFTDRIEEQSIFSLIDEVLVGYDDGEVFLVGLLVNTDVKLTTLSWDLDLVHPLQGVHQHLPD